jgi:hypothetical protein
MVKSKSIVALNNPDDALEIFREKLLPFVLDVRNKRIEVDLGDYAHIFLDHFEMRHRVLWIEETLKNPEEIRKHPDPSKSFREIYLNRIYKNEGDAEGTWQIVVVDARPFPKLWTSFIPANLDYVNNDSKPRQTVWSHQTNAQ